MGDAAPETIEVRGLRFDALRWGPADGPPALLLHGFPQRATSWGAVAPLLAAAGLQVVAPDQRGYSPGARPDDVAAYALHETVADAAAIAETLGEPVHLVGHDWGGVVGWQLAARRPELVRTWTAVSTSEPHALATVLGGSSPESDEQREAFGYMRLFREAGKAEGVLLADDARRLRALYGDAVAPDRVDADVAFFSGAGVLTAALNWYRAMDRADGSGLAAVSVPTTYVWGAEDPAFRRAAAEASGAHVEGPYEFVPLEGVGHWVPDQAPDALAEAILRRVDG